MYTKATIILVAAAVLCSCGGQGGTAGEAPSQTAFTSLSARAVTPLSSVEGSPQLTTDISIQYMSGDDSTAQTVNNAIEQRIFRLSGLPPGEAVDSFAAMLSDDYTRTYRRFFNADRDNRERWAQYEHYCNITATTAAGRQGVTTYTATISSYNGGAHGIVQTVTLNFDNDTGAPLTADDVFVPGYRNRLEEALLDALERQTGARGMDELRERGYLKGMGIYVPDNFLLNKDSVAFVFNVYEIAPYSMGPITLSIPYDDITDLLMER